MLFILIVNQYHELWRDEIHSWYIVQSSHSFSNLWYNVDYEGHPIGWYTILYIAKQFYNSIHVQEWVHLAFVFGTAFLLVFKSPFSLLLKTFLLFGYFFGYEYAILQRNYAPAIFLIIMSFQLFLQQKKNLPYILLLLAGFINIHAFIISCLLYLFYSIENNKGKISFQKILPDVLILFVYSILFYFDIKPEAKDVDMHYELKWTFSHIKEMLFSFNDAFFKAGAISKKIGLNNFVWASLLFLISCLAPLVLFKRNKNVIFLWFSICLSFFIFWLLFFKPYMRHSGHIWLMLIICSWYILEKHCNEWHSRLIHSVLIIIGVFHLFLASKKYIYDIKHPVSQIENVADYLSKKDLSKTLLIGHIDYCTSPIGCLLKKDMYYPQSPNRNDFIQYTTSRIKSYNSSEIKTYTENLLDTYIKRTPPYLYNQAILISNKELKKLDNKKIATFFNAATREEENYYLYLFDEN